GRAQLQGHGGVAAKRRRNEEQPIEPADQAGKTIITLRDERALAIHPLAGHAFRPLSRADSCWSVGSAPSRGSLRSLREDVSATRWQRVAICHVLWRFADGTAAENESNA